MNPINVFSPFDGMSCAQQALERAGIPVRVYIASEVDKYAVKVTQANYPNTQQWGSVSSIRGWMLPRIDLMIGGSPCQGFSSAGKHLNFSDPRSVLFFEYVRILNELRAINPNIKFLLENVRMKQEYQDVISHYLGVKPICINSALVSAQNRVRYYWTNIEGVEQPGDREIYLRDIVQHDIVDPKYLSDGSNYGGGDQLNREYRSQANIIHSMDGECASLCAGTHGYVNGHIQICGAAVQSRRINKYGVYDDRPEVPIVRRLEIRKDEKSNAITATNSRSVLRIQVGEASDINGHDILKRIYSVDGKSPTLNTMGGGNREPKIAINKQHWRKKLYPIECERLQTVPDGYTDHVSNTQRYKMLGNGMTVDVIAHILKQYALIRQYRSVSQ